MTEYELSFSIILHAGDARSKAMEAIKQINKYDFDNADKTIKEAQQELKKAHQIQTNLIQGEANGDGVIPNVLLIHAQDHFTMAMLSIDNAKQTMIMMRRIEELESKLGR